MRREKRGEARNERRAKLCDETRRGHNNRTRGERDDVRQEKPELDGGQER